MPGELSLFAFALLMLGAQFSPGPDMILLTRNALLYSRRAALMTVGGIALGLSAHCVLILGGVAVAFERSPAAFAVLRMAGGVYLAWLGTRLLVSAWRGDGDATTADTSVPLGARGAFLQGLMTNLLNAKAVLFLLAALTAFHPAGSPPWRKWAMSGIVVGQSALFWSLFVMVLNRPSGRQFFQRRAGWINGIFGVLLLVTAVAAVWPRW